MLTEVLFRQMIRSDTGVVLLCVFGGGLVVVFGGATVAVAVDCFGRRTADDDIVD
ncbi:hypothetical protein Hanom_Chr11g01039021 [Helianthus anomalus]